MHRTLTKILVALALAIGLTYAGAGTSTAAPIAARAADCTAQQNAADSANATAAAAQAAVVKTKKAVTKAKKAVKKATSTVAKKKAKKKLTKARAKYNRAVSRRDASASAASARQSELAACRANSGGTTTTPTPQSGPTASQIQVLCDNGLPQAVCDGLGGLIPGGSSLSSIATLCNQVPNAAQLCVLLTSGPSIDPNTLVDVLDQVLTTLGLENLLGQVGALLGVGSVYTPTQLTDLLTQLGLTALVP